MRGYKNRKICISLNKLAKRDLFSFYSNETTLRSICAQCCHKSVRLSSVCL